MALNSSGVREGPPRVARHSSSPLTEHAYTAIRDAIAALTLRPGQLLTEASLAQWLGSGHTPVREALIRLRDEGLVVSMPRRGYYVSEISAEDAQVIYETLEGLEGMAVKLAAERATPGDVARLEEAIRRQETALEADDLEAWASADEDTHRIILEIAGNPQIQRIVESLNVRIKRFRWFTLRMRPKPVASTQAHRAEMEAIRAGDGATARQIRQDHWSQARQERVELLRSYAGPNGAI